MVPIATKYDAAMVRTIMNFRILDLLFERHAAAKPLQKGV
jgi:hypothetical protein